MLGNAPPIIDLKVIRRVLDDGWRLEVFRPVKDTYEVVASKNVDQHTHRRFNRTAGTPEEAMTAVARAARGHIER